MSAIDLTPDAVREAIAELTAPLRAQYENVEEAISTKNRELLELRELRREIVTALNAVDPTFQSTKSKQLKAAAATKKNGHDPKWMSRTVPPEKAQTIDAWLEAHAAEISDGFTMNFVADSLYQEGTGIGKDIVFAHLYREHEAGKLRLDRKSRGGGNVYKLTK